MTLELNNVEVLKDNYIYSYKRADDDPEESGIVQGIEEVFNNAGKWDIIEKWRILADNGGCF